MPLRGIHAGTVPVHRYLVQYKYRYSTTYEYTIGWPARSKSCFVLFYDAYASHIASSIYRSFFFCFLSFICCALLPITMCCDTDAVDEENIVLCCACCCGHCGLYNDCDCMGCSGKIGLCCLNCAVCLKPGAGCLPCCCCGPSCECDGCALLKVQLQCCCLAITAAIPCDEEVPPLVSVLGCTMYPKCGCCMPIKEAMRRD